MEKIMNRHVSTEAVPERAASSSRLRIAPKSLMLSLALVCGVSIAAVHAASPAAPTYAGAHNVHLNIAIGSATMTATLDDNPTARDLVAQLPVSLTLRDLGQAEKVSGALPKRLSEQGARARDAGARGEIAYYAPWGNIAFYRGQGPNAAGVIKIGRITSGIEALNQTGNVDIKISVAP